MKKVKEVKKVVGAVKEVLVDGLPLYRQGSEKGKNKPNPKAIGQPNIVSQDKSPYPSTKKVVKPDWGSELVNQVSSDPKALKAFTDENS